MLTMADIEPICEAFDACEASDEFRHHMSLLGGSRVGYLVRRGPIGRDGSLMGKPGRQYDTGCRARALNYAEVMTCIIDPISRQGHVVAVYAVEPQHWEHSDEPIPYEEVANVAITKTMKQMEIIGDE